MPHTALYIIRTHVCIGNHNYYICAESLPISLAKMCSNETTFTCLGCVAHGYNPVIGLTRRSRDSLDSSCIPLLLLIAHGTRVMLSPPWQKLRYMYPKPSYMNRVHCILSIVCASMVHGIVLPRHASGTSVVYKVSTG